MTMKKEIAIATTGFMGVSAFSNEYTHIIEDTHKMAEMSRELLYDKPTKKQKYQVVSPIRTEPKYQNNEMCVCGSGVKYKKCCKIVTLFNN